MAESDLLRLFFLLFCGEHDYLITLPQPQPPINSLQYTAMHSKCIENALFCVAFNSSSVVHFEGIAVHCSELVWGWG